MKRLVNLLLITILLALPITALAQTDEIDLDEILADFETFESEDGLASLMYPADWVVEEDDSGAFTVGSNEEVIARLDDPEGNPEAGDLAISIIYFPTEYSGLLGIAGDNVEALATSFGTYLIGETTGNEDDGFEVDPAESVDLREDLEVGVMAFRSEKAEGRIIIFELTPDILVWVVVAGYPDDVEAHTNDIYALVSTISYNGTIDDLLLSLE